MADDPPVPASPVTPLQLFVGFATISIVGFGGVMPWVRWLVVDRRRWCSAEEFASLFALANFLPGGNVLGVSVMVGGRLAGRRGSLAAVLGLVAPAAVLVCLLAELYRRNAHLEAVQGMVAGMGSAAAGLIAAMGLRMVWPLRKSPRALVIVLLVVTAAAVLRLPLVWILATMLPASLIAARLTER
ncbi:chromate transporter [Cereibacter sphaeroides]|uniref:chromate transporter n=1 Tax=Cereibacter sphaeroides TaxID=1063 RepID=UPI000191CE38|nr:chromate transporter [Cereibacter sphaeroides]ACM04102.1 Chromate transporter [Cereibacter sphaeroides KD131]